MAQFQTKIAEGIAKKKANILNQVYDSSAPLSCETLTVGYEFEFVLAHYRDPRDAHKFNIYDHGPDVVRCILSIHGTSPCSWCHRQSAKCEGAEPFDDPGHPNDPPTKKHPRRRSPGDDDDDDDDENSDGRYGQGGNVQGNTTYQPPTAPAA